MLSSLGYLWREAFRMMGRHRGITLVSIVIMAFSLLMFDVFLLLTDNLLLFLDRAREDVAVYVYLDDPLSQEWVKSLGDRILALPQVQQVEFISKDQAWEELRSDLGEEADLLDAVGSNPLPASFRVKVKKGFRKTETLADMARTISQWKGVEEVRYGKEFVEKFTSLTRGFLYVDAVVGAIILLSSIFIIANTVRLTVVNRRKTIEILKLVGATDGFVATPFLIEGAFQGGAAAALSLLLLAPVYWGAKSVLPDLNFLSAGRAAVFLLVCLAVGALGSGAALRKYLRG